MMSFLQRGLAVTLLSGMVMTALPAHATGSREQVGQGILKTVETVNRLDGDVYIVDHKKVDGNTNKRLYRVADAGTGELEQLYKVRGSKKVNDVTFSLNGDLYMTATPKKGTQVNVYRSQDQGTTWNAVAQIGFELSGVRNEIVQNFTLNGRTFLVLTQNTVANTGDHRTIGIWSSSNGTAWDQQELSYVGKDMVYKDYAATDATGYLLVSSNLSSAADPILYSVTDTTFTQLSNTGITTEPLYSASDVAVVNDVILVSGWTNANASAVVVDSTDGVTWSTMTELSNETNYYTGYPDLLNFQGTGYILHQDASSYASTISTTDGAVSTAATLGFESSLSNSLSNGMTINLTPSTGGNRLFVSVYNVSDTSTVYCGVMDTAGTWHTTDYCAYGFKLGTDHRVVGGAEHKGTDAAVMTDQYVYDLSGTHLYRFTY